MGRYIKSNLLLLVLFKALKRSHLCTFLCVLTLQLVSTKDLIAGSLKFAALHL